jgi:hypothetical protein
MSEYRGHESPELHVLREILHELKKQEHTLREIKQELKPKQMLHNGCTVITIQG